MPVADHISETVQVTITVLITNRNSYTMIRLVQRSTEEWRWFFCLRCGYRSLFRLTSI